MAKYQWRLTRAGTWILSNGEADIGHAYANPAGTWTGEPWGRATRHFDNAQDAKAWIEAELNVRLCVVRVIDRDIDRYAADIEEIGRRMRRCAPSLEPFYLACLAGAQAAHDALIAYRAALDTPHEPDSELEC